MAEPSSEKAAAEPVGAATAPASPDSSATAPKRPRTPFVVLRGEVSAWKGALFGLLCIVLCLAAWWMLTRGSPEERILSPSILPSPQATFESFPSLWFDRALTRNAYASLRRVTLGFGLAALVGVPLGVLCGCFPGVNAFFAPLTIMGRNIPVAALIPLTFSLFGIGEFQKVMFIFVACVAFIIIDAATAIREIESRYVDTAFTLGANRRQVIFKVLVPLALPGIFNSLRLLFGLAFGYIMLAELVKLGDTSGGLGDIINTSLRRGIQTHIILVLMIIPLVALAIDRFLLWVQRQLFPYRYGGSGLLHRGVRFVLRGCEDAKSLLFRSATIPATTADDPRETR